MADEGESLVCIGTAFDIPNEDAPKKKAVPVHEQYATDNEGRRRFHGAFSGGFSAGYFNTVGSKEGWKPSAFVSSRLKRFESSRQKPEDFMDEEDLGEFGISPRNVETTKLFSRDNESREKRNQPFESTPGVSFDSMMKYALQDLVVPCQMSIGVRLLKRMGWKEGQGIGPRVRQLPKKKVYGCILPPGPSASEKGDDEYDIYAEGLLFAPKDTKTIKFTPKDNLHGIGYQGMLAPKPMEISKPGFSGNLKIKGQAFGVGAFEDDDEDVYSQDSISNYDIELHDRKPLHSDLHGWTGPPSQAIKAGALTHFAKASKPKPANKVFTPPSVPKGYQPFVDIQETYNVKQDETAMAHLTSDARGKLLGEQPPSKVIKSVFDLITQDDRERIALTKSALQTSSSVVKTELTQQRSNACAVGFQPFSKDPAKQARYDRFLKSRKSGSNTPDELQYGLTEWEREREKEEFSRAAMLYQPLKGDIAARFTRARNMDDDGSNKSHSRSAKKESMSVEEKAAEMKMFGKLTRKTLKWHPSKLLCKRFNIPEPYPSSRKTGVVCEKKDELTLATLFDTSQKDGNVATTCLNKTAIVSENLKTESGERDIIERLNIDEKVKNNSAPGVMVTSEQKRIEKPSMDLFKAIFASSSEDESENSDNEQLNNEQSNQRWEDEGNSNADMIPVSGQQTKISHGNKFEETHTEDNFEKTGTQVSVGASNNQIEKAIPEPNIEQNQNVVKLEEEYGPRPPPLRSQVEESGVKLKFQPRQTAPFSGYDSNSESDSDRPKRKHKKKQKHKSKHKNKDKDKDKDNTRKSESKKLRKNDRVVSSDSRLKFDESNKQTGQSQHKELPDDKQILSKLKAVQKRRMCAADFM